MRALELDNVFLVNGRLAIKLKTFAKLLNYAERYLLTLIKKLAQKRIRIAFKWRRNWYIFLPTLPIQTIIRNKNHSNNQSGESAITPSGNNINTNWNAAIEELPSNVNDTLAKTSFNIITVNERLVISVSSQSTSSSSSLLTSKGLTTFTPLSQGVFPATKDYKYGYYIVYKDDRMSTFDPGTSGTLKSTQLPAAFFETCRALDAAENTRNGANPGLTPRRNISTTVSFDTGTIAVAATIPITPSVGTGGAVNIVASDYLGSSYSTFANGSGDLNSDTLPEAVLELASLLAAAEKAVTPAENQPNNIQINFDLEAGNAVISANLPFTTSAATNGDVTVHAIDYL